MSQAQDRYISDRSKGLFIDSFSSKFYKNKKINDDNVKKPYSNKKFPIHALKFGII